MTRSFKDLLVIAGISAGVFILSYFFNVFVFLVEFFQKYPRAIMWIDEIVTVLLTLSIGFAVFSWRRWQDLKQETAQRLKAEQELIDALETKAEMERIISKQLRCEIELRKGLQNKQ